MSEQRLIDANKLWEKVFSYEFGWSNEDVVAELKQASTIEAVPVVCGKWISPTKISGYIVPLPHCSECNEHQNDETNFCPNCGARMDGDSECLRRV